MKKLSGNVERDKEVNSFLAEQGWAVLRFWVSGVEKDTESCVRTILEYCGKG